MTCLSSRRRWPTAPRAHSLFPINALVNDQLKALLKLDLLLGKQALRIAKYTGAQDSNSRKAIRAREPHILLTNPEMLHLSFLQWHQNWEWLWRNLRQVVIDEIHTYRGVFGSSMVRVLQRLRRVAEHYGSHPQYICCSATIANPRELTETLTGERFSVVDRDGAPRGRKFFVLWNPPLTENGDSNLRRSHTQESVDLLLDCTRVGLNTMLFARSRNLAEHMLRMTQSDNGEDAERGEIASYRAGYLATEREAIENKLKAGKIRGIITTNALEMGIDIGGLDAAILSGYPGTVMSTWQQAGRAGRLGRDALVLMVASQNPLDHYYVEHPQGFLAEPHELAVVDPENQHIKLKHLLCAAHELPFIHSELAALSEVTQSAIADLQGLGMLVPCQVDKDAGLTYDKEHRPIHMRVSLRSASHGTYRIVTVESQEIGTIELPNAFREAHPGAIYQHGGDDYRVTFLDRARKIERVRTEHAPNYTRSSGSLAVRVAGISASRVLDLGAGPLTVHLGDLLVEERVQSYQELRLGSDELVKRVNLDYPLTIRFSTTGMWIEVPKDIVQQLRAPVSPAAREQESCPDMDGGADSRLTDGLHAIQHLVTGTIPLLVMCDRRDVNGYHHACHPDVGAPALFLYDAYSGGIGLAETAYERAEDLLRVAHETVSRCPCSSGCPSCIQSGACRLRNESLDKVAARTIMTALSGSDEPVSLSSVFEAPISRSLSQHGTRPTPGPRGLDRERSRWRALEELQAMTERMGLRRQSIPAKEASSGPELQWSEGDWLNHPRHGRGIVVSSHLEEGREMVTVRFLRRGTVLDGDATRHALRRL